MRKFFTMCMLLAAVMGILTGCGSEPKATPEKKDAGKKIVLGIPWFLFSQNLVA